MAGLVEPFTRDLDWPNFLGGPLDGRPVESGKLDVKSGVIDAVIEDPRPTNVLPGIGPPAALADWTFTQAAYYVKHVSFTAAGRVLRVRVAIHDRMTEQQAAWELLCRAFGLGEPLR